MSEPKTSASPKHVLRWVVLIAAVAVIAVLVRRATAPGSVVVVQVEQSDIVETLAVVGRVRPPSRASLGAAISGTATEVLVREGDRVRRGDVLVRLDDREASAAVRQADAALAEVVAGSTQALAEAEREAIQSERDLARLRAVATEGGLTVQQIEQAEQRAGDAASRLESLRAVAAGGAAGESATVTRARAALEGARARLALTRITAPATGVVLARNVEPGDAVSPGRVLLELAFEGPAELVVFPGEENLSRLRPGASALASADAFPDRVFPAVVSLIAPMVDPAQGTVEVRLTMVEPPEYLLPEMTVSVNVETGRKTGAAVVPEEAVQGLGTGSPWVGVVEDGLLQRVDIVVGLRATGYLEVVSGLAAGASVALSPRLEDVGRRVRIVAAGG